jgi:hypothetical protein
MADKEFIIKLAYELDQSTATGATDSLDALTASTGEASKATEEASKQAEAYATAQKQATAMARRAKELQSEIASKQQELETVLQVGANAQRERDTMAQQMAERTATVVQSSANKQMEAYNRSTRAYVQQARQMQRVGQQAMGITGQLTSANSQLATVSATLGNTMQGFAMGGPIGAGIALAGAGIGILVNKMQEESAKAEEEIRKRGEQLASVVQQTEGELKRLGQAREERKVLDLTKGRREEADAITQAYQQANNALKEHLSQIQQAEASTKQRANDMRAIKEAELELREDLTAEQKVEIKHQIDVEADNMAQEATLKALNDTLESYINDQDRLQADVLMGKEAEQTLAEMPSGDDVREALAQRAKASAQQDLINNKLGEQANKDATGRWTATPGALKVLQKLTDEIDAGRIHSGSEGEAYYYNGRDKTTGLQWISDLYNYTMVNAKTYTDERLTLRAQKLDAVRKYRDSDDIVQRGRKTVADYLGVDIDKVTEEMIPRYLEQIDKTLQQKVTVGLDAGRQLQVQQAKIEVQQGKIDETQRHYDATNKVQELRATKETRDARRADDAKAQQANNAKLHDMQQALRNALNSNDRITDQQVLSLTHQVDALVNTIPQSGKQTQDMFDALYKLCDALATKQAEQAKAAAINAQQARALTKQAIKR